MQLESSQSILQFAQTVKAKGTEGLNQEFVSIPLKDPGRTFAIARELKNRKRNRSLYLMSYDESRVVLPQKTGDDDSASDFINANYVDGYGQKNGYIAAQG